MCAALYVVCRQNLSEVVETRGDMVEATLLRRDVLSVLQNVHFHRDHFDVANAMTALSTVLGKQGAAHASESDRLGRDAAAMVQRLRGPVTALAPASSSPAAYLAAARAPRHVPVPASRMPPFFYSSPRSRRLPGELPDYERDGLEEQADNCRRALAFVQARHGEHSDHVEVAKALRHIAAVIADLGDVTEAVAMLRVSLAMLRRVRGDCDHKGVAKVR